MSQHDRLQEMLARRAELHPAEEERLREHLAACPECRQRAAAYQRQRELLRSLPLAQPPPALRAEVLQHVHQPRATQRTRRRWPLLLAPLAAALVVAIALAGHLGHSPVRTAAPPQHSTSAAPTAPARPSAGPRATPAAHQQATSPATTIPRTPLHPARHTQPPAAHPVPHPTAAVPGNPQPGPVLSQRLPVATPTAQPVTVLAPPVPTATSPLVAVAPVGAAGVAKGAQHAAPRASPVQHPVSTGHLAPATPQPSATPVPPTPAPSSPVPSSPVPPTGTPVPTTPPPPTASPTVVVETPLPAPNRAVPAEAPPVLPAAPRKPFPPLPIFLPPTLVPIPTANPTP